MLCHENQLVIGFDIYMWFSEAAVSIPNDSVSAEQYGVRYFLYCLLSATQEQKDLQYFDELVIITGREKQYPSRYGM